MKGSIGSMTFDIEENLLENHLAKLIDWFGFMVLKATFNNISVILWLTVLLVEETGVPGRKPPTCCKSLTNFSTQIN